MIVLSISRRHVALIRTDNRGLYCGIPVLLVILLNMMFLGFLANRAGYGERQTIQLGKSPSVAESRIRGFILWHTCATRYSAEYDFFMVSS